MQSTTNFLFTAPAAASGVSVTPSASAWVNSSWVTLQASTDAGWVLTNLIVGPDSLAVLEEFEIDVGTGAAASEVVVTTFKGIYEKTFYVSPGILPLPLPLDHIAAGQRVAVRMRKSTTSTDPWTIAAQFYKQPIDGIIQTTTTPQKVYPAAAITALVVSGAPGSWANTAWVQLMASTSTAIVIVGVVPPTGVGTSWEVDLGIGGAGSEVALTTVRLNKNSLAGSDGPQVVPFYAPLDAIPISTRVAVRARSLGGGDMRFAFVYLEKPL